VKRKPHSIDTLEHFSDEIPAGFTLCSHLHDLRELIAPIEEIEKWLNPLLEVCFVGAVAYFEAFFKDHFAASLNICHALIQKLKDI
jgi:hypothetical protein